MFRCSSHSLLDAPRIDCQPNGISEHLSDSKLFNLLPAYWNRIVEAETALIHWHTKHVVSCLAVRGRRALGGGGRLIHYLDMRGCLINLLNVSATTLCRISVAPRAAQAFKLRVFASFATVVYVLHGSNLIRAGDGGGAVPQTAANRAPRIDP